MITIYIANNTNKSLKHELNIINFSYHSIIRVLKLNSKNKETADTINRKLNRSKFFFDYIFITFNFTTTAYQNFTS